MIKRILLLALPVIIILIAFLLYHKKDHVIFPSENLNAIYYSDMEAHKEGKTEPPRHTISDTAIYMEFMLNQGFQYPYAGIKFELDSTDLSGYDRLHLNVEAYRSKSLKVIIHLPYYNNSGAKYPFRVLEKEIPIVNGTYQTSLDKFSTPGWWYRRNRVNEKEAGSLDFSKTLAFLIQTGNSTPVDKEELIMIRSISLSQDLFPFWLSSFIFISSYYAIFFLIVKVGKRNKLVLVPYKELEVKEDSEEQKLFTYLSVHYNDPDLSIEKLNRELGISSSKIPAMIKAKSGISFKQYLNFIRIQEAKRLLKSTDLQITQIAYNVGYNTVTHFNKVFREAESFSPKEFRIQEKAIDNTKKELT